MDEQQQHQLVGLAAVTVAAVLEQGEAGSHFGEVGVIVLSFQFGHVL